MIVMPASDHAQVAYEALADGYDLLTAHHDYDAWTLTLERLAVAHGLTGRRLLDVACGTGKSFLPFLERGYTVTACDVSPAMVAQAARKAEGRAQLLVHDMRALPALGEFDLVTCLDDAVNYLVEAGDVAEAMRRMAANLAPGGVLVFDVNTLSSYRAFYGALSVFPSAEGVVVWQGHATGELAAGDLASATAELLDRDGTGAWRRNSATHHQRHHPRSVVEAALASAGLRCVGAYGMRFDGSTEAGFDEETNSKVIYVARREGER